MKNIIISAVSLLILITTNAFSEVTFEVTYTDEDEPGTGEPGTGFHVRPEARQAVEEAFALVGSWLDHDTVGKIEVTSVMLPECTEALACAISNDRKETVIPGIHHTHLARKILFNENDNEWEFDAKIMVIFNDEDLFAYGDEVQSNQVDFKAIIVHELTHALGFTSWIECDEDETDIKLEDVYRYYQGFGHTIKDTKVKELIEQCLKIGLSIDYILLNWELLDSDKKAFTYFDTFLVDEDRRNVIDAEKLEFVGKYLCELKENDPKKVLHFGGSILKDKGMIYELNGMDGSHFDKSTPTVMSSGVMFGSRTRQWHEAERRIMTDLGYKLKPAKKYTWKWVEVEEAD